MGLFLLEEEYGRVESRTLESLEDLARMVDQLEEDKKVEEACPLEEERQEDSFPSLKGMV